MNPLTGSLKFLSSTLFNTLLAFLFFLIAGHFTSPGFVGKVAIIQLMETIAGTFFMLLPGNLITREITDKFSNKENYQNIIYTSLTYSLLISPIFLILLFFPNYLYYSIPYFILYVYTNYQAAILSGLGKFTEVNIGNIIFTIARWGLSIITIFYHSIILLIIIWTLGSLIKLIYYHLFIPFKLELDIKIAKEIIKVGLPIYLSGIISFISSQGDRLITTFLLGSYYLGIYQLVSLISIVPSLLINSLSSPLLPTSVYYNKKGIDYHIMSSLTLRLLTLLSIILGISGFIIVPYFLQIFFPKYILGLEALKILFLSLTLTIPLQILSVFLISAKKNYKIFLIIGSISALEVIILSYILIPLYNITGAAIAQFSNIITSSLLYLYYSYKQGILKLNEKEILSIILIFFSFLSYLNPFIILILVLILIKILKIINKEDIKIVEKFTPAKLRFINKILYLFS